MPHEELVYQKKVNNDRVAHKIQARVRWVHSFVHNEMNVDLPAPVTPIIGMKISVGLNPRVRPRLKDMVVG